MKKKPPKNKWFRAVAYWYSYSTDGYSSEYGPEEVVCVRYEKDAYAFIHKGQAYLHERLGDIVSWELIA